MRILPAELLTPKTLNDLCFYFCPMDGEKTRYPTSPEALVLWYAIKQNKGPGKPVCTFRNAYHFPQDILWCGKLVNRTHTEPLSNLQRFLEIGTPRDTVPPERPWDEPAYDGEFIPKHVYVETWNHKPSSYNNRFPLLPNSNGDGWMTLHQTVFSGVRAGSHPQDYYRENVEIFGVETAQREHLNAVRRAMLLYWLETMLPTPDLGGLGAYPHSSRSTRLDRDLQITVGALRGLLPANPPDTADRWWENL